MAAWGVKLDGAAIDRLTRYCVDLFLHGLVPRETSGRDGAAAPTELNALEEENRRLRQLLVESMLELSVLKEARAADD
jgi:hypothetical protein